MPTFKYHIVPNSQGGYTTRAVLSEPVSQEMFNAEVATLAGVTPEQAAAVMTAAGTAILTCSTGCGGSPGLYGWLAFRPTSGGSEPNPGNFQSTESINPDIALSVAPDRRTDWRGGLTLESLGEKGLVTPVIDTILDITTGQTNKYTTANMIQMRGDNLRFKQSDPNQGTFFRSGANPEVRATLYGQNDPGIVSVAVPATLSGALQVRHAAFINGSVRSFTYTLQITAV